MARNYIVLDTETAPTQQHNDGKVHPETSLVYNVGWMILDGNSHETLVERSYLVSEVFINERWMRSAYYADKVPQYWQDFRESDESEYRLESFLTVYKQFKSDVREYGVKDIWAYNARFDQTALNSTIRYFSNDYVAFFTPYMQKHTKVRWRDIWDYASCITGTKKYVKWAIEHGFVSEKGNPATSAERVYQFLTDDDEFIEEHTALSDARIEAYILQCAKRLHKKTRHSLGQGWRDAAKVAKELN